MVALKCDVCGGQLVMDAKGEFAICRSCGLAYSTDRLKQKVQEIKGIVSIEGSVKVEGVANVDNLLLRAKNFFENMDYEKATEYCEKVLDIDINNENAKLLKKRISDEENYIILCEKFFSYYSHIMLINNNDVEKYNEILKFKNANSSGKYKRIYDKYNKSNFFCSVVMSGYSHIAENMVSDDFDVYVELFPSGQFYKWAGGGGKIWRDYKSADIIKTYDIQKEYRETMFLNFINNPKLTDFLTKHLKNKDELLKNCVESSLYYGAKLALICGANPNDEITINTSYHHQYTYTLVKFCKKHAKPIQKLLVEYGAKDSFF